MPTFVCQSIGQDGLLVEGRIVAGTRVSALEQLRARGHLPVSIAETSEEQASGRFFKFERGRLNDKQLLVSTTSNCWP